MIWSGKKILWLFFLGLFLAGCQKKQVKEGDEKIARVFDVVLYTHDIPSHLLKNIAPKDSLAVVKNFIESWGKKQLLLKKSKLNIAIEKTNIDKLVRQYKENLLIEAYKNGLINEKMDTVITKKEMVSYYEKHLDFFSLNDYLVKYYFLRVPRKNKKYKHYYQLWKKRDSIAFHQLDSIAKKTNQDIIFFADKNTWVKYEYLKKKIPSLDKTTLVKIRSKQKNFKDSQYFYYLEVIDILPPGNPAPLRYIRPLAKKILLHEKAKKMIQEVEIKIVEDAKKNKSFEIY